MNPAAASAAVYSLLAILGLLLALGLLREALRDGFRVRFVEIQNRTPIGRRLETAPDLFSAMRRAVACYQIVSSPALAIRWVVRGFPPPESLLSGSEVRFLLSRL